MSLLQGARDFQKNIRTLSSIFDGDFNQFWLIIKQMLARVCSS